MHTTHKPPLPCLLVAHCRKKKKGDLRAAPRTTFADVAGVGSAKEELTEASRDGEACPCFVALPSAPCFVALHGVLAGSALSSSALGRAQLSACGGKKGSSC